MSDSVAPVFPYGSLLTDGEDIVIVTPDGHWPILDGGDSYLVAEEMTDSEFEEWDLLEPWEVVVFLKDTLDPGDLEVDHAVTVDEDELD